VSRFQIAREININLINEYQKKKQSNCGYNLDLKKYQSWYSGDILKREASWTDWQAKDSFNARYLIKDFSG
jgi:hypothetical protein